MKDYVLVDIRGVATKYKIEKIILFGSRARGDYSTVSDYDIAVFGNGLSSMDKALFCSEIEEINTLKKIDVVFIDESLDDKFIENVMREGVTIYEQTRNKID
ncbi:Predicted nucleotidyltransferase [Natronincola peptidivorans]|uniref:Predicted nucleotidyltransferase n=1 Tax=Natronincola peptidivorans TaxID=426128 RepID=A0A1I0G0Z9_9FIRM|nr:nucleotidyltransferase domain-containing protein [Natronincola peptidivorans]SET64241.1 Predicted nucleotidyltransferase [Natronincola peptidivorans]